MSELRGRLLVAAPALRDPNFRRTVVLVCEHGEDGALGVVLNRRGELPVAEAVPDLAGAFAGDEVLWRGGPVQPEGVVVLVEREGSVHLLGAGEAPSGAARARAYAGLSGWGPGQLEAELEREDWIVVEAEPDDVFAADPDRLWSAVLGRQGGRLALLARMPDDPSLN